MDFVSLHFLAFVLTAVVVQYVIPRRYRYLWMLLISWAFYWIAGGWYLILLIAVSVWTYLMGRLIGGSGISGKGKKWGLFAAVSVLLLLLGYFKYTGMLWDTALRFGAFLGLSAESRVLHIVLPLGLSFYLFQAIGYLIDCYRGKVEPERNFCILALFIGSFCQIVSGPIERAGNMLRQYREPERFDPERLRDALLLILWGYFQKIVIADRLSVIVNSVYGDPGRYAGTIVFLATVCYTMEIYCDFAGYSNIAIGIADLMGIRLMKNFDSPYLSLSVGEFWRRWHISLSSWFRDYLYIPLGGNRRGTARKMINVLIVFALSGLWHGSSWTFMLWGLYHGMLQVAGMLLKPVRDRVVTSLRIRREVWSHLFLKGIATFLFVNIGWILFRAESLSQSVTIFLSMWKPTPWVLMDGSLFQLGLAEADIRLLLFSLLVLGIVDVCNKRQIVVREVLGKQGIWIRWACYIAAILFVITCGVWGPGYDATSFIYSGF